ncbi:MAG: GDP-mannose 4,6-dehydratase [Hydrococcus sp. Prado102]|nr:GDP-mannose 4,6-dehydratase [Hydrococcus sp. Prado102]
MMLCAFVTGGTGFIGANLVRSLLLKGYSVRALVRPDSCLDNLPKNWCVVRWLLRAILY